MEVNNKILMNEETKGLFGTVFQVEIVGVDLLQVDLLTKIY